VPNSKPVHAAAMSRRSTARDTRSIVHIMLPGMLSAKQESVGCTSNHQQKHADEIIEDGRQPSACELNVPASSFKSTYASPGPAAARDLFLDQQGTAFAPWLSPAVWHSGSSDALFRIGCVTASLFRPPSAVA
jgi:hypothetical protein